MPESSEISSELKAAPQSYEEAFAQLNWKNSKAIKSFVAFMVKFYKKLPPHSLKTAVGKTCRADKKDRNV